MSARVVALVLTAAGLVLAVTGLVTGSSSTGVEFGAIAAIGVAWLVHDEARSAQAAP